MWSPVDLADAVRDQAAVAKARQLAARSAAMDSGGGAVLGFESRFFQVPRWEGVVGVVVLFIAHLHGEANRE